MLFVYLIEVVAFLGLTALLLARRWRASRVEAERESLLEAGHVQKAPELRALGLITLLHACVSVLVLSSLSSLPVPPGVAALFGVADVACVVMLVCAAAMLTWVRGGVDDQTVAGWAPLPWWRRSLAWRDVTSLRHRPFLGVFELRSARGERVWITCAARGASRFAAHALTLLSSDVVAPARVALERTRRGAIW